MNHDSAADHKKSWNRKIYYLQVLEKVLSLLQGTAQGGQGRELQRRTEESHVAHAGRRVNARSQGGGNRSIFRALGVGTRPPRPQLQCPPPEPRIHGALEKRGVSGDPHPASLKQSIALLMIPDVLPKVPVSFSGSLPPAVDHVCPRRQGVPQAVKSGSPARTGRSPGAEPPPETGGHGLPGTPRAQPVWSRVRQGTRASVLGLRQQTSGAPASARGETGPKARHPGQPWGEDLNSNTREEQVDI